MGKKLSEDEIGRYGRDGFVCPVEAFSPDQAHGYLDRLEAFEQRDGKQSARATISSRICCSPGSTRSSIIRPSSTRWKI
jgi:hypothetical protein